MSNVLQHPKADGPRVENPRAPGRRPKAIASIHKARVARWNAESERAAPVTVRAVPPPPVVKGKFNYPKSLLRQAYFCRGGDGTWYIPSMHLRMLVDEHFVSPLGALLDQLEQEGHNVGGARAEWMAFRELAKGIESQTSTLRDFIEEIRSGKAAMTVAYLQSGE